MSTLLTETFEGVPGGMNLAIPAQDLEDTQCRYLQDGLVDFPGIVRRRGPGTKVPNVTPLPVGRKGTYPFMTLNPQGIDKYGCFSGDSTNGYFTVWSDDFSLTIDLAWPYPMPNTPPSLPYTYVSANAALLGGAFLGASSAYDAANPNQALALWKGANNANYSAPSLTVARGSANMTAPSGLTANVTSGMWVFANTNEGYTNALVGLVRSVNSNTSLTLTSPSPYALTAKAGTLQAIRGFAPKVVKGEITCDTNSTQVTGGNTKFQSQGLGTGIWQLYRQSDGAFIGKVSTVASDFSLTLTGNAAVACASAPYLALRADADYSVVTTANTNKVGFLTGTYADRQWFANNGAQYEKTARVWFSDTSDPEAVDISSFDGDSIDVTSSSSVNEPIRALAESQNGLCIFKETEAFIVSGLSPSSFTVRKLEDDGAISGMSVQTFAGGVIWAGREGIHFYDGVQVTNITADKLGDYWKNTIRTLDPTKYRMWSMINRDHYCLFIESVSPTIGVIKGVTSSTPTRYTVVMNMTSRAVSIFTNLNIRGAVVLPASAGKSVWYLMNGQMSTDTTDRGYLCDGEAIFNQEGADAIYCDFGTSPVGAAIGGPDFYLETKKFYAGDPLRLKRFKQFAVEYLCQGDFLNVDTVVGLNDIGSTAATKLSPSVFTWDSLRAVVSSWDMLRGIYPTWNAVIQGTFIPKRIRFLKKSQFLSFRIWQNSMNISRLRLGPYGLAYKLQRPGRV